MKRLSKAGNRALGPSSLYRTAAEHPRRLPCPAEEAPRLRVGVAAATRRGKTSLHRGGVRARERGKEGSPVMHSMFVNLMMISGVEQLHNSAATHMPGGLLTR